MKHSDYDGQYLSLKFKPPLSLSHVYTHMTCDNYICPRSLPSNEKNKTKNRVLDSFVLVSVCGFYPLWFCVGSDVKLHKVTLSNK